MISGRIGAIKRQIFYFLEYAAARILSGILALLPFEAAMRLASLTGVLACGLMPERRKIADENIRRAFGDSLSKKEMFDALHPCCGTLRAELVCIWPLRS